MLNKLYPSAENKSKLILPYDALQLVEKYNVAKDQERQFSELKDEAANKLKVLLGDNEIG